MIRPPAALHWLVLLQQTHPTELYLLMLLMVIPILLLSLFMPLDMTLNKPQYVFSSAPGAGCRSCPGVVPGRPQIGRTQVSH